MGKTKSLIKLLDLLTTANVKENLLLTGIAAAGHSSRRNIIWVKVLLEERNKSDALWKEYERECKRTQVEKEQKKYKRECKKGGAAVKKNKAQKTK